jgi:hypothetical protein
MIPFRQPDWHLPKQTSLLLLVCLCDSWLILSHGPGRRKQMPSIFCLLVFSVSILVIACVSTFAQNEPQSNYRNGKLIEISDLLDEQDYERCSVESSKRYGGTVSAVQFRSGLQIGSFTLRTGKANIKIELSPNLYDRISKQDATALPTLVAKGRRITVDTYRCGSKKTVTALYILAGIHMEMLGYLDFGS